MGLDWWLFDGSVLLVLAVVLPVAILIARRRWLARDGGLFEASLRAGGSGAWMLGFGRYSDEALEWFRYYSASPKPKRVFPRAQLAISSRRVPEGAEVLTLYAGNVVVECRTPSGSVELAMSEGAYTGFLAWLEAGPVAPT